MGNHEDAEQAAADRRAISFPVTGGICVFL
jgi:hypothetical protein